MQKPNRKARRSITTRWGTPINSSQQSAGTEECLAVLSYGIVTGQDTPPTSKPLNVKETKSGSTYLTDYEYNHLPLFTIRKVSCCGLMEVSGITNCIAHEIDFRLVICGLHKAFTSQQSRYNQLSDEARKRLGTYETERRGENSPEWINYCLAETQYTHYAHMFSVNVAGQFIFTYTTQNNDTYFEKFAEYVKQNNLGEIWVCPKSFYNPNSHNQVRTVLWSLDNVNWHAFLKSNMKPDHLNPKPKP